MKSVAAEYRIKQLALLLLSLLLGITATFAQIDLSPLDNLTPIEHPPPRSVAPDPQGPKKNNPETAEEFYQMAEWAYERRFEEYAVVNLDKAISLRPDFAKAYNLRGRINVYRNRCEEAVRDFNTEIKISPDSPDAYLFRAQCRAAAKDYRAALADIDRSMEIRTAAKMAKSVLALDRRGRVKYLLGNYKGAIEDFTNAYLPGTFSYPRFFRALAYLKKGEDTKAIADLAFLADLFEKNRARENSDPKTVEFRRRWRESYPSGENPLQVQHPYTSGVPCANGKYPEMWLLEDRIIPGNWFIPHQGSYKLPGLEDFYYFLGDIYEKRGNTEKAIESFSSSIKATLSPSAANSLRRGKLLLRRGEFEPAVRDLSWAICGVSEPGDAHLERGVAILMLNRDDIAQKDFDKFLSFNPKGMKVLTTRVKEARKLREKLMKPDVSVK